MASIPLPPSAGHHYLGPAGDHGAHLCNHAPDTATDTQGCPRWPACLAPGEHPGLLTMRPITDDEAVAFALRWRQTMAQGRPAELIGQSNPGSGMRRAPWYRRFMRWSR